jgi:hypothetical protein
MVLAVVLVVLALILGGVGLLIEGLKWALIIALVLLVAGVIAGAVNRRQL